MDTLPTQQLQIKMCGAYGMCGAKEMLNSFEVLFTWTIKLVLHGYQEELCAY